MKSACAKAKSGQVLTQSPEAIENHSGVDNQQDTAVAVSEPPTKKPYTAIFGYKKLLVYSHLELRDLRLKATDAVSEFYQ